MSYEQMSLKKKKTFTSLCKNIFIEKTAKCFTTNITGHTWHYVKGIHAMWVSLHHAPSTTTLHKKLRCNGFFDPLTNVHSKTPAPGS